MTQTKRLTCGGKGPCCHVGYSHRHCEHCDMVIDTRSSPYYVGPLQPWHGAAPVPAINWGYGNVGHLASNAQRAQNTMGQGALQALNANGRPAVANALPEHSCQEVSP